VIRELERIAYSDIRDVVQWNREPELDSDGNAIGFNDTMTVTPSQSIDPGTDRSDPFRDSKIRGVEA
jgi:hypothetical protein